MSGAVLVICFLTYTGASLLHFAHNATFLAAYPNLPASITTARVYEAWVALVAFGIGGALLLRRGYRRLGLVIISVYGAFGLDGFAHYLRAPMSHHARMMNATIWLEAITGAALMLVCLGIWRRRSGLTL